jgi:rubrerythrin
MKAQMLRWKDIAIGLSKNHTCGVDMIPRTTPNECPRCTAVSNYMKEIDD